MSQPPSTITCVECGGTAHLIGYLPDEDDFVEEGLIVAYRCEDCRDRFDMVWQSDEE